VSGRIRAEDGTLLANARINNHIGRTRTWFIVADIWIPLTPDSTVMRVVTPVSSRVSGYVSHVYVHNNSQVKKGGDGPGRLARRQYDRRSDRPW
uniref:biotin/lipoyl-binding protein n=1 Tax=Klebsiella pneumoniae TaxID=573 RepID=UPI00359C2106